MTEAINFLSLPETMPFTAALLIMLLIGTISALGLDFDFDADVPTVDLAADVGTPATGISMIDWINPGRMPMLAALALFLMIYGLLGLGIQQVLQEAGGMLPAWIMAIAIFPLAYILWNPTSRVMGRVMPRDYTEAINVSSLVGRRGSIEVGVATHERETRAIFSDRHGTRHAMMVKMALPNQEAHQNDEIILMEIGTHGEPSLAIPVEPRSPLTL